jgi:hypothetical protein
MFGKSYFFIPVHQWHIANTLLSFHWRCNFSIKARNLFFGIQHPVDTSLIGSQTAETGPFDTLAGQLNAGRICLLTVSNLQGVTALTRTRKAGKDTRVTFGGIKTG